MKEVQTALKDLIDEGLYVSRGAWMPSAGQMHSPEQYVVYSTTVAEEVKCDDRIATVLEYVYMDLWSEKDPSETANKIRERMYAAGFWCRSETDRGYNQPRWSHMTRAHCIFWTWVYRRNVDYGIGN